MASPCRRPLRLAALAALLSLARAWTYEVGSLLPVMYNESFRTSPLLMEKGHLQLQEYGLPSLHRTLAAVVPGGATAEVSASAKEALDKVLTYGHSLPERVLQRALGGQLDTYRLEQAVRKVLAGQQVKVLFLGGSITAGHDLPEGAISWAETVHSWLQALAPDPEKVLYINNAVGATTASYIAACPDAWVPRDVDIVFLEYDVNEHLTGELDNGGATKAVFDENCDSNRLDNPLRMGYERLLRHLLLLPNSPAVVPVHPYSPGIFRRLFWDTPEDQLYMIGTRYYRLPSVSMRDALFHLMARDQQHFKEADVMFNWVHPTALGHRYLGDLVIAFLQGAAAEAVLGKGAAGSTTQGHRTKLLPPLFEGNYETNGACVRDEELHTAAVQPVAGWEWADEGKAGQHTRKQGWVSRQVDTTLRVALRPKTSSKGLIGVGLLRSYLHMGYALAACEGGCSCKPQQWNMLHGVRVSQSYWHWLSAEFKKGQQCIVAVTNLNLTDSGEHKVKVTSVTMAEGMNDATQFGYFAAEGGFIKDPVKEMGWGAGK